MTPPHVLRSAPLLLALLVVPGSLLAQGDAVTVRVSLPVDDAVGVLEITPASTDLGALSSAALSQGYAQGQGPSFLVRANHGFMVVASAPDPFSGPATKPVSELEVATEGVPFTPLSATGVVLVTSAGGGSLTRAIGYRWLVGFASDPPGAYSLTVDLRLEGN